LQRAPTAGDTVVDTDQAESSSGMSWKLFPGRKRQDNQTKQQSEEETGEDILQPATLELSNRL